MSNKSHLIISVKKSYWIVLEDNMIKNEGRVKHLVYLNINMKFDFYVTSEA